ncbi:MAG: RIP metalloprotease RseP, partial [Gammaproteobacteria bacterium]|nr:RIP metalloprotease RseP [Gammaproteobacteria bacterium]
MSVLHNIFFFIVAIGVLVTFHEYGHYWVARKAGVKVLRFSVGFGRPIFSWRRTSAEGDDIEYVIAAIPLGGYVKMLDEREGDVPEADRARAFNNQSISKRIAIVFAGPAFNFILAIFLYWLVFMMGSTVDRPLVGVTDAGSVAEQAGFQQQDEILMVGDTTVNSWNQFRLEILDQGLNGGNIPVLVRDSDGIESTRTLALGDMHILEDEGDIFKRIGFKQWWPVLQAEIGGVIEQGAADSAGIKKGDIILRVDGVAIESWLSLVEMIRLKPEQSMQFVVLRDAAELAITVVPESRKTEAGE